LVADFRCARKEFFAIQPNIAEQLFDHSVWTLFKEQGAPIPSDHRELAAFDFDRQD